VQGRSFRPLVLLACAVIAASSVIALAAVAGAASASSAPAPLAVSSASLVQDGQQLVWSVRLAGRWSADGLKRDRRSLCLLIERRGASHSLCVARGRHKIELIYGAGKRPHVITAAITRDGAYQMTATFLPAAIGIGYVSIHWQVASGYGITTAEYPTRPKLAKLHTPVLVGCVPAGSSLVYSGPTNVHDIALSFDDGPWPQPPSIDFVNLLAHYHVPATFFEIGDQISEYDPTGSVERAMLANGDMIGDHTWTHPDMAALSPTAQTSELELTVDAIRHATGFSPCLWRPPYGDISPSLISLARSLGLITVMWNIDPRDWSLPGVGEIEGNVLTNARNGGITEMHFGGGPRYETIDSLPDIITTLRARGYKFVSLTTMLGLRLVYK
jgi:peptidoglycan/xylan/chitin deacetylase (PgdA/CDA1 family)